LFALLLQALPEALAAGTRYYIHPVMYACVGIEAQQFEESHSPVRTKDARSGDEPEEEIPAVVIASRNRVVNVSATFGMPSNCTHRSYQSGRSSRWRKSLRNPNWVKLHSLTYALIPGPATFARIAPLPSIITATVLVAPLHDIEYYIRENDVDAFAQGFNSPLHASVVNLSSSHCVESTVQSRTERHNNFCVICLVFVQNQRPPGSRSGKNTRRVDYHSEVWRVTAATPRYTPAAEYSCCPHCFALLQGRASPDAYSILFLELILSIQGDACFPHGVLNTFKHVSMFYEPAGVWPHQEWCHSA
jgi:hypothetical protein